MATVKLRQLTTAKGLTPSELELFNYNYWIIENSLNSVGAVSPVAPGAPPPSTVPIRHDQLLELTDDDHLQYLLLAGRGVGGQNVTNPLIVDGVNFVDKVTKTRLLNTTSPLAGGGDLSADRTITVGDATTTAKGVAELATDGENAANVVVQGNDTRMSNARTPTAHKTTHITGGSDIVESFPIGFVFIAVVSTNPGTLLGYGTWVAFGTGRVLVGINAADPDFDLVEETGGAKTHTLTSAEMPSHTHTQNSHNHTQDSHVHVVGTDVDNEVAGSPGSAQHAGAAGTAVSAGTAATNQAATATNQNTGGGGAHNNVQPYIVVYMWKRTV